MTDIQIKYWSYKEGARHNLATEAQQYNELRESKRHNLITEGQGQQSINENVRHNVQTENIGYIQAQASMMSASAAQTNAAANKMNAETNANISRSTINLNLARTAGQNINNLITGTGANIKGASSVMNAILEPISTSVDTGTKLTNSLTNIYKVFK